MPAEGSQVCCNVRPPSFPAHYYFVRNITEYEEAASCYYIGAETPVLVENRFLTRGACLTEANDMQVHNC